MYRFHRHKWGFYQFKIEKVVALHMEGLTNGWIDPH